MEKILKTRQVFSGKTVIVSEADIDFANGKQSTFELITFKNTQTGVSIFAIDQQTVYLAKHYQLGANKRLLTLPTGGLEIGEDPQKRAQLELQEEIGFKAGQLSLMARIHPIPGYIGTKPTYIYLAQNLSPSKLPGDEAEDIEVVKINLDKLIQLIKQGKIIDGRVILATLYYNTYLRKF